MEELFFQPKAEDYYPKVELSGFNVDLDELKKFMENETLTPEIITAAYARISRSSDELRTLRDKAKEDVSASRASNTRIIYEYGHSSVAEHAYFNFDISRISRLALEYLESFRIASFTEKSQRYVVFSPPDICIPIEIENPEIRKKYIHVISVLFNFYEKANNLLLEKFGNKQKGRCIAQEDSRYILPLATRSQVGFSVNGRSLERIISRLQSSPLSEVRTLGKFLFDEVYDYAPSIIKYVEPHGYFEKSFKYCKDIAELYGKKAAEKNDEDVKLVYFTPNGEERLLGSLLMEHGRLSAEKSFAVVKKMKEEQKEELIRECFYFQEYYQDPPKQFELLELGFEINISATAFAQLKRHRLTTLIKQPYSTSLGLTIPKTISQIGLENEIKEINEQLMELHEELNTNYGNDVASYILTNAHRRRVFIKFNLRNFFSFSRLRLDKHAQWDIREISEKMLDLIKEVYPICSQYITGKDNHRTLLP